MAALPIWLDFMQDYVRSFNVPAEDFPQAPPSFFQNITSLKLKVKATAMPEQEEAPAEDVEQHNDDAATAN